MAASLCLSSSPPLRLSLFNQSPSNFPNFDAITAAACSLSVISPAPFFLKRPFLRQPSRPREIPRRLRRGCRVSAAAEDALPTPDDAQQIVSSAGDDGVNTVVSGLLFIAFIGLSILTIGVIYIAVTDFLQKREREKFDKEEAAKKKSGKKGKVRARARAGPKGFGQKTDDEDELDD
ncbi:hypothetical protein SAY87_016677 [Trapa incisa]|uniref:Transmembrane protein n=1 Tax=Trapa incisa TaxID=236973 RepID=A0AAN7QXP8_9MYRT|nr:hypothetical protein SAY87_016677 [Trapa incisa]